MTDFSGKRYVVTGAASGIGHAVAERLLAAGAEVVSLDRPSSSSIGGQSRWHSTYSRRRVDWPRAWWTRFRLAERW